jgi:hypothetical protein
VAADRRPRTVPAATADGHALRALRRDGDGARRPRPRARHAERAATEAATEQSLRARVGQRTSQRQAQRDSAAEQRERELAEGHAAIRYAAYVTVSVRDSGPGALDELESAVARVELEAKRAPLRLERMWGQQAEAFTYSLPLGRGLR